MDRRRPFYEVFPIAVSFAFSIQSQFLMRGSGALIYNPDEAFLCKVTFASESGLFTLA
jgi:hypothetical protein